MKNLGNFCQLSMISIPGNILELNRTTGSSASYKPGCNYQKQSPFTPKLFPNTGFDFLFGLG